MSFAQYNMDLTYLVPKAISWKKKKKKHFTIILSGAAAHGLLERQWPIPLIYTFGFPERINKGKGSVYFARSRKLVTFYKGHINANHKG